MLQIVKSKICTFFHIMSDKLTKDAIELSTLSIPRLFGRYFLPTLFGMLSISAMTAIDGVFVGHAVGADGIAAINICVPILMLATGLGLMMGAGCSVVASIHMAQHKLKAARINVTQAWIFATLVILAMIVPVMLFPSEIGRMLGSSDVLLPLVREYMIGFMPGELFGVWAALLLFVIRLDGNPRFAMWCNVVTAMTCGAAVSGAFVLFPNQLVELFVDIREAAFPLAVKGFPLIAVSFVFFIVNLTCIGYFQSIERVRPAMVFALMRGLLLLVPSFILLPIVFGETGIWLALAMSEMLTTFGIIEYLTMYK